MKKQAISARGVVALAASMIGALGSPASAAPTTETTGGTIRAESQKQERGTTQTPLSTRSLFGQSLMDGDHTPYIGVGHNPWDAPKFNQRKSRRDARRVNRPVCR